MRPTFLSYLMASLMAASFGISAMADDDRVNFSADRKSREDQAAAAANAKQAEKDRIKADPEISKAVEETSRVTGSIKSVPGTWSPLPVAAPAAASNGSTARSTNSQSAQSQMQTNQPEYDRTGAVSRVSADAEARIRGTTAIKANSQLVQNTMLQTTAPSGAADRLDRAKAHDEKAFRCVEGGFFVNGKSCDPIARFNSTHPELSSAKVTLDKKTAAFSKFTCAANVTKVKGRKVRTKRSGSLSDTALCNPVEYGLQASGEPWCVTRFSRTISANCHAKAFSSSKKETSLAWAMAIRKQFPKLKREQEARRTQICTDNRVNATSGWEMNSNMNNISDVEATCKSLTSSGKIIATAEERAQPNTQVASLAPTPLPPERPAGATK